MAPLNIFKRTSDSSSSSIQIGTLSVPVYAVIGIAVIVAILLGLAIWLIVKTVRKRARRRREDDRGAAFLTVKGVMKDSYVFYVFKIMLAATNNSLTAHPA